MPRNPGLWLLAVVMIAAACVTMAHLMAVPS